jgi:DNA-binding NarL/FixJ family response regulator
MPRSAGRGATPESPRPPRARRASGRARLLIADDHVLVADAFARFLAQWYEIAGTVTDLDEVGPAIAAQRPDIVLLDISFGTRSALYLLPRFKADHPATRFVVVTGHLDPVMVDTALSGGANGYVVKESATAELRKAISAALAGKIYVTPLVRGQRRKRARSAPSPNPPPASFVPTARQLEILRMMRTGHPQTEIADNLGISIKTVEYHLARLRQGLGVRAAESLVRWVEGRGDGRGDGRAAALQDPPPRRRKRPKRPKRPK